MSKVKLSAAKNVKRAQGTETPEKVLKNIIAVYIFCIGCIYPLYYEDAYFNMAVAKWNFYRVVSLAALIALIITGIWYLVNRIRIDKSVLSWKNISTTDKFVLAYLCITVLSYLFSDYKKDALTGCYGWYMGLITQISFVLIYLWISRFYAKDRIVIYGSLIASCIVYLLCILNRLGYDPMGMYKDMPAESIHLFISTLGQSTWFSSYMVLMFPVGLYVYWNGTKEKTGKKDKRFPVLKVLSGAYIFLSGITMIAQNSDSAIIAFSVVMLGLFCFSFDEDKKMKAFLESLILLVAGWRTMGILGKIFADRAYIPDKGMVMLSNGALGLILLIIAVALYVIYVMAIRRQKADITRYKPIRKVILVLIAAVTGITLIYIILNSLGALEGTALASDNNYLKFDEYWGNNRGFTWILAVKTFVKSNLRVKLLGTGPDCFGNLAYELFSYELIEKWGETVVLACAHNEWLNALITTGIVGAAAYIGIFVSSIRDFAKKIKESPDLIPVLLCVFAYVAHNFFCYQQIICTPIVFIIIGAGESICRYGSRMIWEK